MHKITNKALPFFLRTGKRLFLSFLPLVFCLCSTGVIRFTDGLPISEGSALIAVDDGRGTGLLLYENDRFLTWSLLAYTRSDDSIKSMYGLGPSLICVMEKEGILYFPDRKTEPLRLTVGSGMLSHQRIRDLHISERKNTILVYVTYDSPGGSGVTECSITRDNKVACTAWTTKNSGLRSNYVHQVLTDLKGNLWFRYSHREELGVSRLGPDGKWSHFDRYNSQLGAAGVLIMRTEGRNEGFTGDNIWFVTQGGLSRLQYDGGNDQWTYYGDKRTFADTISHALGIRDWFTDAIIDIVDIIFLPDSLLVANKYAVFHFSPGSVNRFLPKTTGGQKELRITRMDYRSGNIIVQIRPHRESKPAIQSLIIFDMAQKEWHDSRCWELERTYPDEVNFIPFNGSMDIMILKYRSGKTRLARYHWKNHAMEALDVTADLIPIDNGKTPSQ